jgi:hypothetical protein
MGETMPLGSMDEANAKVNTGIWQHIEGMTVGGKGGYEDLHGSYCAKSI